MPTPTITSYYTGGEDAFQTTINGQVRQFPTKAAAQAAIDASHQE
jgi:hypothetical protein